MVEEKKQVKFTLRVTKKRMVEVVNYYFPGPGEMDKRLNRVDFHVYESGRRGKLYFYDSHDNFYCAVLSMFCGFRLSFECWDGNLDKWVDCGVFHPDLEYLDLLGMIVKY